MSDVLVLCYHAVSESWAAPLSMAPERLERQLRILLARGYRGATFHRAMTAPPARKTLAVTFDDGYPSVFEQAFPLLSRLGLPGTVFVPTDFIDAGAPLAWPGNDHWLGGPHEHELQPMGWEQLRRLVAAGWEIGSHTCSHPLLPELDDAALATELSASRDRCAERLGLSCRTLAYPFGAADARVAIAAGAAGYEAAATLPLHLHAAEPLRWPRIGVGRDVSDRRFGQLVSPAVRRLRASPLGPPLERGFALRKRLRGAAP